MINSKSSVNVPSKGDNFLDMLVAKIHTIPRKKAEGFTLYFQGDENFGELTVNPAGIYLAKPFGVEYAFVSIPDHRMAMQPLAVQASAHEAAAQFMLNHGGTHLVPLVQIDNDPRKNTLTSNGYVESKPRGHIFLDAYTNVPLWMRKDFGQGLGWKNADDASWGADLSPGIVSSSSLPYENLSDFRWRKSRSY